MAGRIYAEHSEFTEFKNKFRNLLDTDAPMKQAIAETGEKMLQDLIAATPVDTGQLKQQWTKDNPNVAIQVHEVSGGWELTLVNTTEYASWVEKGHNIYNQFGGPYGWCMGRFFVRKTENIWKNGKLDNVLVRRINRWLRETLK